MQTAQEAYRAAREARRPARHVHRREPASPDSVRHMGSRPARIPDTRHSSYTLPEKEPFYFFATDPEDIIKNTTFADNGGKPILCIKESAIDLAANFLTLRTIAYNKIYHNPNVQILQRYAHKALGESGLAKPEILRNLYDEQVEELLLTHPKMRIRMMVHDNLVLGKIPQTAAAILLASPYGSRPRTQPSDFEELVAYGHRAQAMPIEHPFFLPLESAMEVEAIARPEKLLFLEQEIAAMINNYNPKKSETVRRRHSDRRAEQHPQEKARIRTDRVRRHSEEPLRDEARATERHGPATARPLGDQDRSAGLHQRAQPDGYRCV